MKKTSKKTETSDEEEAKEEAYRLLFINELTRLHKAQFPQFSKEVEAAFKIEFGVFEEDDD